MSTEGQLLFRAVLESPDDDPRRLVYADWLEDHGQEALAVFIRLQVEMRAGSGPQEHEHRAAALLASKFRAWMPGWLAPREARAEVSGFRLDVTEDLNRGTLGIVPTLRARAHYAGGFIERIELRADAWMTTGLDLFRKA